MGNWIKIPVPDPKSTKDFVIGARVQAGLRQDWTLLQWSYFEKGSANEGVMLVVRPHPYHPFVTEFFTFREDGELICYMGTYHETLQEAIDTYNGRSRS